jgi:hypothetical protein
MAFQMTTGEGPMGRIGKSYVNRCAGNSCTRFYYKAFSLCNVYFVAKLQCVAYQRFSKLSSHVTFRSQPLARSTRIELLSSPSQWEGVCSPRLRERGVRGERWMSLAMN